MTCWRIKQKGHIQRDCPQSDEAQVMVGRCLVDLGKDIVPVRVLNPSSQEYKVKKGTDISSCEPLGSVFSPCIGEKSTEYHGS